MLIKKITVFFRQVVIKMILLIKRITKTHVNVLIPNKLRVLFISYFSFIELYENTILHEHSIQNPFQEPEHLLHQNRKNSY